MYQRAGLNVGSCGWNVKRTACASETWGLPVYQIVEAESNGSSSFDRTQFKSTQMKKKLQTLQKQTVVVLRTLNHI